MRILVVEDEHKLAGAIREGLQADDYGVVLAYTGEEGLSLVETERFHYAITKGVQ